MQREQRQNNRAMAGAPSDPTNEWLFLRRQYLLNAYLIDEMVAFDVNEVRSLFIIGEICADSLRHHHDECLISHVQPIAPPNEFVRCVPYERAVGIDG